MELLEAGKEGFFQSHVLGCDRLQNLSVKVQNYQEKNDISISNSWMPARTSRRPIMSDHLHERKYRDNASGNSLLTHVMLLHSSKGIVEGLKVGDTIFRVGSNSCSISISSQLRKIEQEVYPEDTT